jgi:peptide/nickel transport system substrate-binding protein
MTLRRHPSRRAALMLGAGALAAGGLPRLAVAREPRPMTFIDSPYWAEKVASGGPCRSSSCACRNRRA